VRLPIVFFMIGNHGDISRFLQELINQMETMMQQVEIQIVYLRGMNRLEKNVSGNSI
jgi:hypothetical protein